MKIQKLSIDFGNTNTIVYVQTDIGETRPLALPAISVDDILLSEDSAEQLITAVPTQVFCQESLDVLIGKQAFPAVERTNSASAYRDYGFNFKKDLLNAAGEVADSDVPVHEQPLRYGRAFLTKLCSYIIEEINRAYEGGESIPVIAITVPVSAPLEYRRWLKEVISVSLPAQDTVVLDEATCAAYYYNHSVQQGDNVLVVDIGGSTTDFALVEISRMSDGTPSSRILARHGLRLGGTDIDIMIADHILRRNQLPPLNTCSLKTQKRIVLLAEKAKKVLTTRDRFAEELYDPDLSASISFIIDKSELCDLIVNSSIPDSFSSFFVDCRRHAQESGCQLDVVAYTAFVGGSFLQPLLYDVVAKALAGADFPAADGSRLNKAQTFYAVAAGAIHLSSVKIEGLCLLNSIFLRTGKQQEVNFKLLFGKGDAYPTSSKDFALGKVDKDQTHFKFWLAELDSFQDLGGGASYRPITYNGKFYRMKLPPDAEAGDFRFITRFSIDEDLRIFVSVYDEETGVNLYSRQEIGNDRSEIAYLDVSGDPRSLDGVNGQDGGSFVDRREKLFLADEKHAETQAHLIPSIGKKVTETEILFSRPSNTFESLVEQEIVGWSLPGWIITGSTVPGSPWKPDHVLILKNGVVFVLEDKDYSGAWIGSENGSWKCDGKQILCGQTKGVEDDNPLREVEKSFHAALARAKLLGVSEPFGVATVVAPSDADIAGVALEKTHKLVKLDHLYHLVSWAIGRQNLKIREGLISAPGITREQVCQAFGIGL